MTFVFDKNYKDHEQVREFLPEFAKLHDDMEAAGKGTYNAAFKGLIAGIQGDDEDTAIYLLQSLHDIEREHARVAKLRDDGYTTLDALAKTTRFKKIVVYKANHYVGGTGIIATYEGARVLPDENGKPYAVLPKGKRVNGYDVRGAEVLVAPKGGLNG